MSRLDIVFHWDASSAIMPTGSTPRCEDYAFVRRFRNPEEDKPMDSEIVERPLEAISRGMW